MTMKPSAMSTHVMTDQRQQAYLDAMGIETWCLRNPPEVTAPVAEIPVTGSMVADNGPVEAATVTAEPAPLAAAPGLKLGPGRGGVLLVCAEDTESASRLANDINRTIGRTPVWGWPHTGEQTVGLADAVEENLFTTVGIFGEQLGGQFFADGVPQNLKSANLVILPSMRDLEANAQARKALWSALCRFAMVTASDHQA
jgi:DNA polymerase III psi subunit